MSTPVADVSAVTTGLQVSAEASGTERLIEYLIEIGLLLRNSASSRLRVPKNGTSQEPVAIIQD